MNLKSMLSMIKDTGDKVLLILDDCISDIRGKGKAEVENLLHRMFFNRRHLAGKGGSLSIIATSQTYNKIDPKLRKTASQLVLFENKNKKELDSIYDEAILIPKKEFYEVLRYIYDKKYQFMYKMIHKCFNQLEIKSPNIMGDNYFDNVELVNKSH